MVFEYLRPPDIQTIAITRGMSEPRPRRMHDAMSGNVERGEVPGLVTLVSRREEVHVDVIGAKALDGAPVERDTIFRASSMSEPGRLSLSNHLKRTIR